MPLDATPGRKRTALAAPAGARWHRVALQVNPYSYHGAAAPSTRFPDEQSYNEAIVLACVVLNIELISITDHWCIRTAENLAQAAEAAGVVVLPGFEAVSSEDVHLLVLFEHGTGYGLLAVLQGQALIRAWRNEHVHAVAVSPGRPLTTLQERILRNQEKEYRRAHAPARLHADDISDPTRLGTGGGSCWVKMSTPSLTALDVATRTAETRIMLVEPALSPHPAIETISWEGGFLDGVRMRLSSYSACPTEDDETGTAVPVVAA